MKSNLHQYEQYFFDCDGVILKSNHIKSEAFYLVAKTFSPDLAGDFLKYHQSFGGISRFEKFKYFFSEMMKLQNYEAELERALRLFKEQCVLGLKNCDVVDGINDFLVSLNPSSKKYVVSGGVEEEVVEALAQKKLAQHFNGIFGSPKTKFEIMEKIYQPGLQSIYLGDAKLDYEVSQKYNCDFVFVSGQTEFNDYVNFFKGKDSLIIKNFLEA